MNEKEYMKAFRLDLRLMENVLGAESAISIMQSTLDDIKEEVKSVHQYVTCPFYRADDEYYEYLDEHDEDSARWDNAGVYFKQHRATGRFNRKIRNMTFINKMRRIMRDELRRLKSEK